MRLSQGFWQSYKEVPSDAEIISHQLLVRAGFISKSAGGIYNYLPMMVRTLRKIENIIREELEKIGAQEVVMSVVTPGELWQETGRWDKMEGLMLKFQDRGERDLCISPTNEEAVTDIFRKAIKSYKQLPVNLYQINTKFRDEIRPRFGLMRGREFVMKDAYTFHLNKENLDQVYQQYYEAYIRIFSRMGLQFIIVEADAGAMAASDAKTHEFQVVANSGEDQVVCTEDGSYAANIEKAKTIRGGLDFLSNTNLEEVATPSKKTIQSVCEHLDIKLHHSLKSLVYSGVVGDEQKTSLVVLLGDDDLNEVKLKSRWGVDHLRPADQKTLNELGFVQGSIGPQKALDGVEVFVDQAINLEKAFVAGANKVDTHVKGLVPSRDIKSFKHVDLRLAKEGDLAPDKKKKVLFRKGIEVGHIFQLGDHYTKKMKATVLGQDGKELAPLMGCYGIGVSRTLQAAIEQSHDKDGIIWPKSIAPYHVYFVSICKSDEYKMIAEEIYQEFLKNNLEVIWDDRKGGPGPKFKDADLLGLPIRVVMGERDFSKSGELELRARQTGKTISVKRESLVKETLELLDECK